jgi:hypothetical protein
MTRLWRGSSPPDVTPWLPRDAPYPRLRSVAAAALGGTGSGVYACWHLGIRPRWLRVGGAVQLPTAIASLQNCADVTQHDANGGVFVAWTFLAQEAVAGVVSHLIAQLQPAVQAVVLPGEIAPTIDMRAYPLPPGTAPPRP